MKQIPTEFLINIQFYHPWLEKKSVYQPSVWLRRVLKLRVEFCHRLSIILPLLQEVAATELVTDSVEDHLMVDVIVTVCVIITEIVAMISLSNVEMNLLQETNLSQDLT